MGRGELSAHHPRLESPRARYVGRALPGGRSLFETHDRARTMPLSADERSVLAPWAAGDVDS